MIKKKERAIPQTYTIQAEAVRKLNDLSKYYNCSRSYVLSQLIIENYEKIKREKSEVK